MEDEENREALAEEWEDFETVDNETAFSANIDDLITQSQELPSDWYVLEGVNASQDNGYLGSREQSSTAMHLDSEVVYSDLQPENIMNNLKIVSTTFHSNAAPSTIQDNSDAQVTPHVYLTDDHETQLMISRTIDKFTLNEEQ